MRMLARLVVHALDREAGFRVRGKGSPAETVPRARSCETEAGPKGDRDLDPLKLLKQDHDKVKSLLEELDATTERATKTRTEMLATLKQELTVHETIEEEILYPALKEFSKTKEIALEAYEEHHVVDAIMAELEGTPVEDEMWGAKLTVMKENLEHHIEEEEDEMFKQARQVMDTYELDSLGERMPARKEELQAEQG
jgi:iron-sulfur cluster repair protein YtfE (RIC family)